MEDIQEYAVWSSAPFGRKRDAAHFCPACSHSDAASYIFDRYYDQSPQNRTVEFRVALKGSTDVRNIHITTKVMRIVEEV